MYIMLHYLRKVVTLHEKKELVSMDNVDLFKANYFPWIGITILHEKLITLYIEGFSKLVKFN